MTNRTVRHFFWSRGTMKKLFTANWGRESLETHLLDSELPKGKVHSLLISASCFPYQQQTRTIAPKLKHTHLCGQGAYAEQNEKHRRMKHTCNCNFNTTHFGHGTPGLTGSIVTGVTPQPPTGTCLSVLCPLPWPSYPGCHALKRMSRKPGY